ncbi:hypothetical protein BDR26DRAFT_858101 [Obelidium mucronatum]|nr:hypothetical protein BDR26DRAFT_858101 [Obelidium mucronatum]
MARTKQTYRREQQSRPSPSAIFVPASASSSSEGSVTEAPSPPVWTGSHASSITIINSAIIPLSIAAEYSDYASMVTIPAQQSQKVFLEGFSKAFVIANSAAGVVFKETSTLKWTTLVKSWGTVWGVWAPADAVLEFCDDPQNPPLSLNEFRQIEFKLMHEIEHCPRPDAESIWTQLAHSLNRTSADDLKRIYGGSPHKPSSWSTMYRQEMLNELHPPMEHILAALKAGTFEIHAYWRCLDWFPGYSCQDVTTKYVFSFHNKELELKAYTFMNEDKNPVCVGPYPPHQAKLELATAASFEKLYSDILKESSRSTDSRHWETEDVMEYSPDWFSREVLLYVPIKWTPSTHHLFPQSTQKMCLGLLHVNRHVSKSLPNELIYLIIQFASYNDFSPMVESGYGNGALVYILHDLNICGMNESEEELLEVLNEVVGIGSPIEWTGNGFEDGAELISRAGKDCRSAPRVEGLWNDFGCIHPIYMRW